MLIETTIDPIQTDNGDRKHMATCPGCGQKLVKVESIYRRSVFRIKCRRCKRYITVDVKDDIAG